MGLKLLCMVAHPDDECFAFGGALALAAKRGVETHVVCLTDGQAASNRGEAASAEDLGKMRREEFAASCDVLGVTRHETWDYQDGRLESADFSSTAGRIVGKIRELRPNVLLTFGSDGSLNTHPDHTMVSVLTCAGFHWAASERRYPNLGPVHRADRLYVQTTSYFMDGRPAPMPAPWTATLDVRSVMARKHEAFCRHTSQRPLMERTKAMFEEFGQFERYTLLAAEKPQPASQTTDLFDGLEG